MENSAILKAFELLAKGIYTTQATSTMLLHLEIERISRETGRTIEDVTEEINARIVAIHEKTVKNVVG